VHVSLSEIQSTICKAALGVGLPLGLGEDAGWAARNMMTNGIGSISVFAEALDAIEEGKSTGFDADRAGAGYFTSKPAGFLLSAIWAGPSTCDLVASTTSRNSKFSTITLINVDVPSVILFEVLASTVGVPKGLCVAWNAGSNDEIEAVCWRGSLSLIKGMRKDLLLTAPANITIQLVNQKPPDQSMDVYRCIQREAVEIHASSWRRITIYADRLLVDASDTSRLTGAGAGSIIELD
jgi:hypothetical protein